MDKVTSVSTETKITEKLTLEEGLELDKCENIILKHQQAFFEFGAAVRIIREKRLYRAKFKTWNEYCHNRWGWTESRANQVVNQLSVIEELPKQLADAVTNERAARALGTVAKEDRAKVVESLLAAKKPVTGKNITDAATKVKKNTDVELDGTGHPIPVEITPLWRRSDEIQEVLTELTRLKTRLKDAHQANDKLWAETNFTRAINELENVYQTVKASKPFAVCMRCQGHPDTQKDGCRLCMGRGLIGEFRYRTVPEEERKMREKGKK